MNNFKAWWGSLETREQQLAAAAAFVILIAVFYWGLWTPLTNNLTEQQTKLDKQEQLLSWMKEKGPSIMASKNNKAISGANQSLSQIINATARQKQIKLSRVQPKGEEAIQVWIDDIPFSTLLTWLQLLEQRYAISVSNTELQKADKLGFAKVRKLQLERK